VGYLSGAFYACPILYLPGVSYQGIGMQVKEYKKLTP